MFLLTNHRMILGGDQVGYKIEYSPETAYCYPQHNVRKKRNYGRWICTLFLVGAMLWMRVYGIPDFLIPGDPVVTRSATAAFMDDLSEGVSVNDAVTAFCRNILDGAGA